jgi:hypothetical protein
MTTRKQITINKYNELLESIKLYTDIKILPILDVDNFSLYVIINYFELYFFNRDEIQVIKDIILEKQLDIDDDTLNLIIPDIKIFLDFIHNYYFVK